ncbi:MAG: magnesium/cobalt transporter CorA [Chlorobiaceae bacterium]|jgi:magnesium transporter|nr:magnesium/cobalt transporter CorA [Chlorobiaceae bacterium]
MKRKKKTEPGRSGNLNRQNAAKKVLRSRQKTFGQPAGSLTYIGEQRLEKPVITIMGYDEGQQITKTITDVHECISLKKQFRVLWVNVDGVYDPGIMEQIGEVFGINALTLEDILHTGQRPKVEDFEAYLYLVLQMIEFNQEKGEIIQEQLSLIIGDSYVITFQEKPGDMFDPVRQRIRTAGTKLRKYAADYLAYSLIDAVVDDYFSILEDIENTIDRLDIELIETYSQQAFHSLYALKRELIILRKSIWPLREEIGSITRDDFAVIGDAVEPYFRDVYDHIILVIDTIEVFRDIVTGMHETYLAGINNRMNEIMKVLTIIATVFMPLSFLTGVFGMNFRVIPGLEWQWGFYVTIGVMGVIFAGMMLYFRTRKWF